MVFVFVEITAMIFLLLSFLSLINILHIYKAQKVKIVVTIGKARTVSEKAIICL